MEGITYTTNTQYPYNTWDNYDSESWITVNCKVYYELVEKARKWDNLMKLLEVKE